MSTIKLIHKTTFYRTNIQSAVLSDSFDDNGIEHNGHPDLDCCCMHNINDFSLVLQEIFQRRKINTTIVVLHMIILCMAL